MFGASALLNIGRAFDSQRSLFFDGVSGYVDLGTSAPVQYERTDSFWFSGWVRRDRASHTNTEIFIENLTGASGTEKGVQIAVINANRLRIVLFGNGFGTSIAVDSNRGVRRDDGWVFWAANYDGSSLASGVTLWLAKDGDVNPIVDQIAPATDSLGTTSIASTQNWNMARRRYNASNFFRGAQDQVIFGKKGTQIDQAKVNELYNSGNMTDALDVSFTADIEQVWESRNNDFTDFPVIDEIKNAGTGTATNMAAGDVRTHNPQRVVQGSFRSVPGTQVTGVYARAATDPSIQFGVGTPFSVTFWVRRRIQTPSDVHVSNQSSINRGWRVSSNDVADDLNWALVDGNGNSIGRVSNGGVVPRDNQTRHVVCTYNGSSDGSGFLIYLNGVLLAPGTQVNGPLTATAVSTAPLAIGVDSDRFTFFSAADYSNVAIYNKELSLAEIQAIYNNGDFFDLRTLPTSPNLLRYYGPFDDDVSPTLKDKVGGFDATINNPQSDSINGWGPL